MKARNIDWRKVITGKDAAFYVDDENGVAQLVGSAQSITITCDHTNQQIQPLDQYEILEIPASVARSLAFSEFVVEDETLYERYVNSINAGQPLAISVEAVLKRRQEYNTNHIEEQRVRATDCIPTGSISFLNVAGAGEVVTRDWNFFINGILRLNSKFRR